MMAHYFRACGGINVFAIFFRFSFKITNKYKELLQQYAEFFGDGLWKHCSIFITYCDMDSKQRKKAVIKGLQTTKDQINSFLQEISNGQCNDVPIYTFGMENFKQSTFDFLVSLMDERNAFYTKSKCGNIKSPIDILYGELKQKVKQHEKLTNELQTLSGKVKEAADKVQFDRMTMMGNEMQTNVEGREEVLHDLQDWQTTTKSSSFKARYMQWYNSLQQDTNDYNKWLNE
eukprot:1069980_1